MNKPILAAALVVATGAGSFWLLSEGNSKDSPAPSVDKTSVQFKESQSTTQAFPPNVTSMRTEPETIDQHDSLDFVSVEKEPYLLAASPDSMALIATSDEERNIGPVLNADEMLYTIEDVEEQNVGAYIEVEMPD